MSGLFENLSKKVLGKNIKIVFPEGEDVRVQKAAIRLKQKKLLVPILLGNKKAIFQRSYQNKLDLSGIKIIDPKKFPLNLYKSFVSRMVKRRNGKISLTDAKKRLLNVSYFGIMLLYTGRVDGMVSGAIHSTADTLKPALQIIKTDKESKRVSSSFLLIKGDKKYLFADPAVNIKVDSNLLVEITRQTIKMAKSLQIEPKVALLSFSTKGSAKDENVDKVMKATKKAKVLMPSEKIDGELQFDAAIDPGVAKIKASQSKVAGLANVFIFPNLDAANIGYKIAQRLGKFEAIGPLLQGLGKPVNDLSRGSNSEDIYKLSIITASETL